jgi:hypothetical protein
VRHDDFHQFSQKNSYGFDMGIRFYATVSLIAVLFISCVPSQTKTSEPTFKEGDIWVLEGTNASNKQSFSFELRITNVLSNSPFDSGIAAAQENSYTSYTAEISFYPREKDLTTFVDMRPNSSSDPRILCMLKQTDQWVKRYYGSSFFGSDLEELNTARKQNDSSKLGVCSFFPKNKL